MRFLFSLALIGIFTSLSAQEVTYPYNPDANDDQYVAVSDVLSTISAFGSGFLPTEILINNTELTEIINQLLDAISVLQSENLSQESLLSTQSQQIAFLITAVNNLQDLCENCGGIDQDSDGIFDNEDSCVDLTACNYNADPTENCLFNDAIGECGGDCESDSNNDGICDPVCNGCEDEEGVCYEIGAQEIISECESRTCTIGGWGNIENPSLYGCTNNNACNYSLCASLDDGSCVFCDDFNPCTVDLCEWGECVFYPSPPNSCDDGNACTYMDMCVNGQCVGEIINCDDGDPTTYDNCIDGSCVHTTIPID